MISPAIGPGRWIRRGALTLFLFAALPFLPACDAPTTPAPPAIAVSVEPLRFLAERLAGDAVEVLVAVPPGASPATYQPTDAEMARLRGALRYFSIGVPMERGPWFAAIREGSKVIDLGRGLERRELAEHAGHDGHDGHDEHAPRAGGAALDPHLWLSPRSLEVMADTMAAALREALPTEEASIEKQRRELRIELRALDAELARRLEPYRGRVFVVYHPSWGYFADDYGLIQVAVESAGHEPGDAQLAELRELAAEHGVTALFVQPQIHGRSAERLAELLGVERVTIDPLAANLPDNRRRVSEALVRSWAGSE